MRKGTELPHLFIPGKITTLILEFAVEDLPLGRTAVLVHEFAVKIPALGQNTLMIYEGLRRVNSTGHWRS